MDCWLYQEVIEQVNTSVIESLQINQNAITAWWTICFCIYLSVQYHVITGLSQVSSDGRFPFSQVGKGAHKETLPIRM